MMNSQPKQAIPTAGIIGIVMGVIVVLSLIYAKATGTRFR